MRVTTAAICGSDLHLYHGLAPDTRIGHVFGHECVGIVEEVGPDVRNLRKDDRVVVPCNIPCGRCFYCQRGLWAGCEHANPYAVAIIGVYGPPFNHFFPIGWAMNRNLTFRMGQCNVKTYLDDLLAKTPQGEIDPSFVVSHQLPLAEAPHGYQIFERRVDQAIKVLLKPGVAA